MGGLLFYAIEFFILSLLLINEDVRTFCLAYVVILLVNIGLINTPNEMFYWKKAISDILLLYFCMSIQTDWKRYCLGGVIICSLLMNVYEGLHTYQTIIYPYRDTVQWLMVEVMVIILAWKSDWRGMNCVKLRRNLLQ